ncbi:MAG TPA: OsmC family protein [Hyphomicrobiaceae bacterium]|nr:OsmC family protein [Hyphomicrobiaceae bacterium]
MKADELRALQAPLKQKYKEDPTTARIPARAEGTLELDGVACNVKVWKGATKSGLHPAGGGSGELACSADMLLEALVGCAGVTLAAVATAMSIPIKGGKVIAEGVWDARGTLGVDRTAPIGLTEVALRFEIESDAPAEKVAKMVEMAERYCVIAQTLKNPPKVTVSHTQS